MQGDITFKCVDCPTMVTISTEEAEFITSHLDVQGKPYTLPKRCKPCRDKKKIRYASAETKRQTNQVLDRLSRGETVSLN